MEILQHKIEGWDQKSAEAIREIYDQHHLDNGFTADTIELIASRSAESGATWLLKENFERGNMLTTEETHQLFLNLPALHQWSSKLHILQCLPYLQINSEDKARVELFIRECLLEKNKFVRAWAYNGFYLLGQQHQEYQQEASKLLEVALEIEAPSVKARIRNLLKDSG